MANWKHTLTSALSNSSDKHTAVVYIVCPLQLVLDHHCTENLPQLAIQSCFVLVLIFHFSLRQTPLSVFCSNFSYCIIDYSRYFFFFSSLLPTGTASTLFEE